MHRDETGKKDVAVATWTGYVVARGMSQTISRSKTPSLRKEIGTVQAEIQEKQTAQTSAARRLSSFSPDKLLA